MKAVYTWLCMCNYTLGALYLEVGLPLIRCRLTSMTLSLKEPQAILGFEYLFPVAKLYLNPDSIIVGFTLVSSAAYALASCICS